MKKLKFLVGAVALFAVVAVNVWNAATTFSGSDLNITDVEAMANPEGRGGSGIGGEWVAGDVEDARYFTMSGSQVGYSYTYSGNSYIKTCYQPWECEPRTDKFQCNPGETRRYPHRVTVWSWGVDKGPIEGDVPGTNKWDGYVLPY